MPNDGRIHLADIGTLLDCVFKDRDGVVVDISLATTLELNFERPNQTAFTRAGVLTTNGIDGGMRYTTVAGDLDATGYWHLQGRVVFPSGATFRSDRVRFRVWPNNAIPA